VTTIGNPGQHPPNPPPAHVTAGGQLGQAHPRAAGPNVPAAQVNVPCARQLGQAPLGAAGPNVAGIVPDNVATAGHKRYARRADAQVERSNLYLISQ